MKSKLTDNTMLKIMAFLFAVVLWLIVVNIEDPIISKTYKNVKVNVTHGEVITNKGYTYRVVDDTQLVNVTVKAKRSTLDDIKAEHIVATADVKNMQFEMKGSRDDASRSENQIPISVYIPGFDVEEAYATPINLQIVVEDNASTTFPITAMAVGEVQDGYVLGSLTSIPETIKISGPKSLVNRINKVVARADVDGLQKSSILKAELIFYDSGDNVVDQTLLETELKEGGVSVDVEVLNTKHVKLKIDTSEIYTAEGYTVANVAYEPQTIQIVGSSEDLKNISVLDVPAAALNVRELKEKRQVVVDISKYLPENIRLYDENANTVIFTITVAKAGTKAIDYPVQSIEKRNVPDNMSVSFGDLEDIVLHITGPSLTLDNVDLKGFVYIDLKGYKEGTHTVPVQVKLPAGCSLAEEITVTVIIEKQ